MIFDGKKLASGKEALLKEQVAKLDVKPVLLAIRIGDDEASKIYLSLKAKVAQRIGIVFKEKVFPEQVNVEKVIGVIEEANLDDSVRGILAQLPLPEQQRTENPPNRRDNRQQRILETIDPEKDVDCLTPTNLGLLMMGQSKFLPATVKGILEIIQSSKCKIQGARVTLVGGSNIVGKPLAMVLSNLGATVTLCRSHTQDLKEHTLRADILVSATGQANLIKADMVKTGAVVIDAGSPHTEVDFERVQHQASFITPVPGGVGPMTVICLFENLVEAILSDIPEVSS